MTKDIEAPPRQAPERAETPVEAAAINLDLYGKVRLDVMTRLLDLPDDHAARTAFGTGSPRNSDT
ncbi:hypothetical protein SHO565_77940 [Streptomyces sp. HO565]